MIETYIESHRQEARIDTRKQHSPLPEDSRRDGSPVATTELLGNEKDDHKTKPKNAAPNFRIIPRISGTAPLQG